MTGYYLLKWRKYKVIALEDLVIEIINQFGYLGIFLLLAIECIFPPIPSELILTLGGFITLYSDLTFVGVLTAATLGSVIGAVVLYFLGTVLDSKRLEKIITGRMGKIFRLKSGDVRKAEYWFGKYGGKAVFWGRIIPIVRSLISIPAGMAKMSFRKFLSLTILGTLIWNMVLMLLGRAAGSAWNQMLNLLGLLSNIVLIILFLLTIFVSAVFIKKRFIKKDR